MSTYTRHANTGTGPGEITPDGCAVEVYARLPESGETDIVASAVAESRGLTLLELGAGSERMTRPLVRRGFRVTAVDESPGMLGMVEDARTVCSAIEDLALGERFDVVTLTSFLVNTADDDLRTGLLDACARHVASDGCVVIQRQHDSRHEDVRPGHGWHAGGMTVTTTDVEQVGDGLTRSRVEYTSEGLTWVQTYYSRLLTEPIFAETLSAAGLRVDRWLTERHDWVRAVPVS
ncbi:class I SAM-dependent methyltransferase [Streptomyces tubbatahanensis]|uniref:Class I SAM-dependent methyltransferase n=1 Tax=Streptomyces tubbatahanensis TaxID=2923272 RepID=A0ABY3XN91_9ACTN|nr:class I SAM-dependent methyltransferase [Streptomyces tubbatahanensis]UNS95917.1 class I SAM-dependent methyltransferase [Streptomyces tubbatahanensis]